MQRKEVANFSMDWNDGEEDDEEEEQAEDLDRFHAPAQLP